jgi:uncharacterized protein (TIGR02611 family)
MAGDETDAVSPVLPAPPRTGFVARVGGLRAKVRALPGGWVLWRVTVTVAGVATIAVGIVLLPLPGPGWVIIFAGLGLLGSEYEWAARLLRRTRGLVRSWTMWSLRQNLAVRVLIGLLGVAVVVGAALGAWWLVRLA